MEAEAQPAPRKNKATWLKVGEVILSVAGAIVILVGLYKYAQWNHREDLYSSTTTAVGAFITSLALLWPQVGKFTGSGALHQADTAQGSRFIATAGVVVTIGGILADDHLGWPALKFIVVATVISFAALLIPFFGLASRRQHIEDKAAKQRDQ